MKILSKMIVIYFINIIIAWLTLALWWEKPALSGHDFSEQKIN